MNKADSRQFPSRIIIIVLLSVLSSCGYELWYEPEYGFGEYEITQFINNNPDSSENQIMDYISTWVFQNIKYVSDPSGKDIWQTPDETYLIRQGDCEDRTLLWMYFINYYLGYEPELWGVRVPGGLHAVGALPGKYYFYVIDDMGEDWDIWIKHDYYYALWLAEEKK